MKALFSKSILRCCMIIILAAMVAFPARALKASAARPLIDGLGDSAQACALYQSKGEIGCRQASAAEVDYLRQSRRDQNLHSIAPYQTAQAGGLTIILRATSQLEAYPQAKAAFLKAAAIWESVIQTPITITIDVDFGTTWFGEDFPEGVVGFTNPQLLLGDPLYPNLWYHMLDTAPTRKRYDLYLAMPSDHITTDLGDTQMVVAPSALFRVWGYIDSTANPDNEPVSWGSPPAIGFDSRVAYDFDPSDGIDADKVDFDAVASHEIGHVLGFISYVGQTEMNPKRPVAVSAWDMFRTGPGTTIDTLATAVRIQSSGGNQVFFAGDDYLNLSTGRPDGSGGDQRQASHWKDAALSNQLRIGVMNPSLASGKRATITLRDLAALDAFGYSIKTPGNTSPTIKDLSGDLEGDILTLNGTLADVDGDVVQAQLDLLDNKGNLVGKTAPFAVDIGIPPTQFFSVPLAHMGSLPMVMQARLTLIDTQGNHSKAMTTDFSGGQKGGPSVSSVGYKKDVLTVKGKRFGDQPQVEINGVILNPPAGFDTQSRKKLALEGQPGSLNLRVGPNRIRILSDGRHSNIMVIDM